MSDFTVKQPAAQQDIVLTRLFDAPPQLVWKVFTDPGLVSRWWGPKYFTSPSCQVDLRVGGKFLYAMQSPDGQVSWNGGVYHEIRPPQRLVYSIGFTDEHGSPVPASRYGLSADFPQEMWDTVTFEEAPGGRTRLTLRRTGTPPGPFIELTAAGWSTSLDKFGEVLAGLQNRPFLLAEPGRQEISASRTFNAPPGLVFRAYTEPQLLAQWWGPRYLTTTVEKLEPRPGGQWRFVQRDAQGNVHAFHGVYHAATPQRLVYTFEYEGTPGHVLLETVSFEEQDGRTRVVEQAVFQSVADRDAMLQEGMEQGARESMERLQELLEKM